MQLNIGFGLSVNQAKIFKGWVRQMSDYKKRVEEAMLKFHKKDLKEIEKLSGKKKRNKKPEKEVESSCLEWMRAQGWVVQVIESKATLSNGVWRNQAVKAGNADCQGVMPDGVAIYVEFKAPGKLKTFWNERNQRQQDFITERINMFAFSCVVDSVELLSDIYRAWKALPQEKKRAYLLSRLP